MQRRLAILTLTVLTALVGQADAGRAVLDTSTERLVSAGFHLGTVEQPIEVTVEAMSTRVITKAGALQPSLPSTSSACVTVEFPGTDRATQKLCGPADVRVSPTLDTAMVSGAFHGIDFDLVFAATSSPTPSVDPTPLASSIAVSRAGSANAKLVGDIFGTPTPEWSSWYAEAKEKAKSSSQQ